MNNDQGEMFGDDTLGIAIEVFIKDGECFSVTYNGKEVRARVIDYDVTFPCTAHGLGLDAEGEYYMETIV